ncbi:hypothetical protein [Gangjinia marincola]
MKIKILVLILIAGISFSCDTEFEEVVYEPNSEKSLVYFEESSVNIDVPENETITTTLSILITSISNSERSINLSYVEEDSELPSSVISFPSQITVPANSYTGTFEIEVMDDDLITSTRQDVFLQLSESNNISVDEDSSLLRLRISN